MRPIILSFFSLLLSSSLLACPRGYDLPMEVKIPVGLSEGGTTEAEFMKISSDIENIYAPVVAAQGGKLRVYKEWASETVNAYAQRQDGEWKVIMLGGIARHKYMTADGYALVVCHEIGHHLGGLPKYVGMDIGWASNEGQSDYYSTMKCLRNYWKDADNAAAISGREIPQKLVDECNSKWSAKGDQALCIRSGLAGFSVSYVFAALAWNWTKPKFETPDKKEVKETYGAHPKAQCRLDTYFQGSLCEVSFEEEMSSETNGSCHEALGHKSGMRPLCWFKPTL